MSSEDGPRGMDIVFFDPHRRGPNIGRHGKVTGIAAPGLVHITIWTDPDLDLKGPMEEIRGVPLHTGHIPPSLVGKPYCRPVQRDAMRRPRGRPPKTEAGQAWKDQQFQPEASMAVRRRA